MSHEHIQPDIPENRLQANYSQAKASMWTDIGEAQITHTIFGRAKVRIIRKHDKVRRAFWLTGITVTAMAVIAWQAWFAAQQTDSEQSADGVSMPASTKVQVSEPAVQTGNIALPVTPLPEKSKPTAPLQPAVGGLALAQKSSPLAASSLSGAMPNAVKPVTPPLLPGSKPQMAAPAPAMQNAADNTAQPVVGIPAKLPLVVAAPRTPQPAAIKPLAPVLNKPIGVTAQPAASSPVAATPSIAPLNKETTSTPSTSIDKKLTDPINPPH
jgi:hypothetical protein